MVHAGCSCNAVAVIIAVNGPSMAPATMPAFSGPVASSRQRRASRMVPTPMVMAQCGTRFRLGKSGAFCIRVVRVSVCKRVREWNADSGSLNPK